MLDRLFTYVLDLTVPAGIVILLVMLLRLMLKGQKKIWSYALWLVVLLRLLIPAGIALPMGDLAVPAFTSRYTLSDAEITLPEVLEGMSQGTPTVSVDGTLDGEAQTISCNWWELAVLCGKYLWLAGVIAVLLWAGVRYWRLKRKLREAVLLQDNVYVLDDITTPFVLGLVRPKIYLPSGLKEQEQAHILLHEQRHIDRDDHIFRVVAFLVLCLHWFNPLVWAAFMLSGRDMEMSCDEAVTRHMDGDERADYAQCLLRCTAGKAHIAGMPLAFSEGDTGKRIHNLANWKKPVLWLCILAVALSVPLVFIRPASAAEPAKMLCDNDRVQGALADLNGDGCPEFCEKKGRAVFVYDNRTRKRYQFWDSDFIYGLMIENGQLYLKREPDSVNQPEGYYTTTGKLWLVGDVLIMVSPDGVYFGRFTGTDVRLGYEIE